MALRLINLPVDYFPDPSKGRPIFNGQIFVGEPDTDPQVPINQKQVTARQESGAEVPIPQPVRTSAGGVPEYNGATVQILVDGNYSIKVLSKQGAQEYFLPNVFDGQPIVAGDDHNLLGNRDDIGSHDSTAIDFVPDKFIQIGEGATASIRDVFLAKREITTITGSHAFRDETDIQSISDSGTYGAFDAQTQYSHTSGTANHLYAFQGRGVKNGAGDLSNYASFYHAPNLNGGTVSALHGIRILNNTGNSTINDHHGVHIPLLDGAVNSYAIFSWGKTPSVHVGRITLGSTVIDPKSAFSVENISSMTTLNKVGINSNCTTGDVATTSFSAYRGNANVIDGVNVSITNTYKADNAQLGGGATIGTQNGFTCSDLTAGTSNRGYESLVSEGSGKWNFYASGTAQNWFNGNVGVGVLRSAPNAAIDIAPADGSVLSAPLRFGAGVNIATPIDGTFEFDGTNLFFTVGGIRRIVNLT